MRYDPETDEYYASTSYEKYLEAVMDSWPQCIRCQDKKPERDGFRLVSGEFVCFDCKPESLQSGIIYQCLSCGDYFLAPLDELTPQFCPADTPKPNEGKP